MDSHDIPEIDIIHCNKFRVVMCGTRILTNRSMVVRVHALITLSHYCDQEPAKQPIPAPVPITNIATTETTLNPTPMVVEGGSRSARYRDRTSVRRSIT